MVEKECWARKAFIQLRIEIVKKQPLPHHHFTPAELKTEASSPGSPCYALLIDNLVSPKGVRKKGAEEKN